MFLSGFLNYFFAYSVCSLQHTFTSTNREIVKANKTLVSDYVVSMSNNFYKVLIIITELVCTNAISVKIFEFVDSNIWSSLQQK